MNKKEETSSRFTRASPPDTFKWVSPVSISNLTLAYPLNPVIPRRPSREGLIMHSLRRELQSSQRNTAFIFKRNASVRAHWSSSTASRCSPQSDHDGCCCCCRPPPHPAPDPVSTSLIAAARPAVRCHHRVFIRLNEAHRCTYAGSLFPAVRIMGRWALVPVCVCVCVCVCGHVQVHRVFACMCWTPNYSLVRVGNVIFFWGAIFAPTDWNLGAFKKKLEALF